MTRRKNWERAWLVFGWLDEKISSKQLLEVIKEEEGRAERQ